MSNTSLSRLDQVFTLLENGGSQITRKAAAKQLGDVQKKHPQELNNLLAKLLVYTKHEDWNVRISTSEAIESIISEVPIWDPKSTVKTDNKTPQEFIEDKLTFEGFNVDRVLNGSQLLLGSSGEEYQINEDFKGLDPKAKIIKQRKVLEKKLGLNFAGNAGIGVSSNDLFDDKDLESYSKPNIKVENIKEENKISCSSVMSQLGEGLSSREKNRAKRKAKLLLKQMSRDGHQKKENEERECHQPATKKRKKGEKGVKVELEVNLDLIPPHNPLYEEWTEWPLEWISGELMNSLFSQNWEERHGACIALKVIIKKHGTCCGKVNGMTDDQLKNFHHSWLVDLSIRLLCVITIDRFADYVSDQVVAPVRESCAQTLSLVVGYLNKSAVYEVLKILLYLNTKNEWEIRQSSMLAIQYIIAIRQDLQDEILSQCFPIILNGLQDKDGDVKSVSAKALMPTTLLLAKNPKYQNELRTLLTILWESLKVYDELTASTQSIMILLSQLIQEIPRQTISTGMNLPVLVARLWPFLHHVVVSVRKAALITLTNIIDTGNNEEENSAWLSHIDVDACWNLFQCCLLERDAKVREKAAKVFELFVRRCPSLSATPSHVSTWMSLSCQPQGVSFDIAMLIQHNNNHKICEGSNNDQQKLIGGSPSQCSGDYEAYVMTTREYITRMVGQVCCHVIKTNRGNTSFLQAICQQLGLFITSQSAMQRIVASMVLKFWWEECNETNITFPPCGELHDILTQVQQESLYYSEVTIVYIQVQTDIKALVSSMQQKAINLQCFPFKSVYSFTEVQEFCQVHFPQIVTQPDKVLQNQRDLLLKLTSEAQKSQTCLDDRVKVYIASCLVSAAQSSGENQWKLPGKLNPIIRPLMDTLKRESNTTVCKTTSTTLAHLMGLCKLREKCPNAKLINNLCNSLISSTIRCPTLESISTEFNKETLNTCSLSLNKIKTDALITQLRRTAACISETSSKRKKKIGNTVDANDNDMSTVIASKGAQCCFEIIFKIYGNNVFEVLPQLWNLIEQICTVNSTTNGVESNHLSNHNNVDKLLVISQSLSIIQVIVPVLAETSLQNQFLSLLPHITSLLCHDHSPVRFMSSRCLSTMTKYFPDKIMPIVVEKILPNFDRIDNVIKRKGTIELVANIIETMHHDVVPYTVLLIVPLLGRMSDHDVQIRLLATQCFAKLIQFMPVESSIPDPPHLPASLVEKKQRERRFLEQLFDCSSLDEYKVPVVIKATLRSYQEDGVKWLAFLNRYKLHGVLCDDMGLGKTLQTICIMSSDHYYKELDDKGNPERPRLISIVICPPTLTGHWVEEVGKFCDCFKILHYYGSPSERQKLQEGVSKHNLVVASYDVVRNDIQFFSKIKWNYCVLDEGHAIRNGKSKTAISIKSLISNHRLILSGTPIQNSVLELWSLFDFLMPGFLGSAQEFNHRYTKPILNSRDAKSSSKEQEDGLLAMESLHRQVLPFMLRRMKEDVLKDLPPKTIQDYYCDLSPLQLQLYEDFAKTQAKKDAESSIHNSNDESVRTKGTSHVFQALQYLQKVCNHPLFVLTPSHPHYNSTISQLKQKNSSLHDIKHASKLVALQQLLIDCGIGVPVTENPGLEVSVVNQHRCLIFCQHRNMLDIIEHDLFRDKMKTVTFLRLDGSIPTNQRYSITSKFNSDPSIDVLLLTTKVGGLGLNLTGADTVIFVEHDWNPMVDLQAMDRAHRIGQKRTVNVYRLITRGTLEQKILGLQKFKLKVADAVLGEDNRGLHSMGTNQVLDLFSVNKGSSKEGKSHQHNSEVSRGFRAMIDTLEELWDQNQYDEEYNLDNFMHSLK